MRTLPLASLMLIAFVAGCSEHREPRPIDREAITTAFARAGEPLALSLDDASDSESGISAIYVPRSARTSLSEPYALVLAKSEADAEVFLRVTAPQLNGEVQRRENAILLLRPSITAERRASLSAILASL
jgi:hypothetical protein